MDSGETHELSVSRGLIANLTIQDGQREVAVKVVSKDFIKHDRKILVNVESEIRVLKLLRGCEYVVHLFHVQVCVVNAVANYAFTCNLRN